jgi:peptidoglycan/xylan/chitin deacetylase (PgdA/CDA1 family)
MAGPEVTRWDITRPEAPSPRQAAYRDIARLCRGLAPDEREVALTSLVAQLGEPPAVHMHRRLSPAEVAELAASPVVEVGAHSVSHTPPSVLSSERRAREFLGCKHQLEEMTGRSIDLLSYPFGARGDLTHACGRLARECGYMAACANWPGSVWRQSDPYRLPRFLVRDWSGEHFADRLGAWLGGGD